MNELGTEKRERIVAALVEGNSLRAVARMTGIHRTTIMKLLCDLGRACSEYQDKVFRNLKCKRVQCDEIWSFVYAKGKNCPVEQKAKGGGDAWTWVAIDPDTKLVPCWFIGQRDANCAFHFMHDLKARLANKVQLTTDGYKPYFVAVEDAFGATVDYAMLQKIYGKVKDTPETRYSRMHGSTKSDHQGQSRSRPHFYKLCRTPESDNADFDAPIHAPHECVFKEIGESGACGCAPLHVLQLLSDASDASRNASNGSRD